MKKKNEACLNYKGEEFMIHQDDKDNWRFSYGSLADVNTQHKDLQFALNEIYATIREKRPKERSKRIPHPMGPSWGRVDDR